MHDDISDLLSVFLQCSIYTILKARGVYPEDSFKRRRVFGHLAWWTDCVEVEDYTTRLCESLRVALTQNRLRRMLLPIYTAGVLRERYAIEFLGSIYSLDALESEELNQALVLAITKLEMSPVLLATGGVPARPLTESVGELPTWSVLVETREGTGNSEETLGPRWEAEGDTARALGPAPVLHPLKSILGASRVGEGPPVILNVYIEETRSRSR